MRTFFWLLGLAVCLFLIGLFTRFPWWVTARNARDWNVDQAVLPEITRTGDLVSIKNIRNFTYETATSFTPAYYDATYNVNDVQTIDFIVVAF